jgi:hypothetical protein
LQTLVDVLGVSFVFSLFSRVSNFSSRVSNFF